MEPTEFIKQQQEIEADVLYKELENIVSKLRSKFDTVQIFCTKSDVKTGDTGTFINGSGNYYARYGQISKWVIEEEVE